MYIHSYYLLPFCREDKVGRIGFHLFRFLVALTTIKINIERDCMQKNVAEKPEVGWLEDARSVGHRNFREDEAPEESSGG